jgi:hypothetical protein
MRRHDFHRPARRHVEHLDGGTLRGVQVVYLKTEGDLEDK